MPTKFLDVLVWVSCLAASVRGDVQVSVSQQSFDPVAGGSVTLSVHRGEGLCCSAWDWVGIYQNDVRLSYAHSGDDTNPGFNATLAIPPGSGSYTFAYSTSVDSWQIHSLGITLSFGEEEEAPAIPMAAMIPSYWWPTDPAWAQLQAAVEGSGLPAERVTVILNPNNGNITHEEVPSAAAWALWRSRALDVSSAGHPVLAYVNLCSEVVDFQCAAAAHQGDKAFHGDHGVKAEIDMYVAELGAHLVGLFFDDAGHSGLHTGAILQATEYANSLGLSTVHNPGVLSQDPVLFAAANATVLRDGPTPGDVNPFQAGLPAEKSAMVLQNVTADAWRNSLDLARVRGFKYFYAAESWTTCPPYIGDLLTAIAATPLSATETLTGTSLTIEQTATSGAHQSSTTASTLTTDTLQVSCSPIRLLCPLPADLAAGAYDIQGHHGGAAAGSCAMQEVANMRYFDMNVSECNVTVTEAEGKRNMSAVLVPRTGTLVFADAVLPTLLCSCIYDTAATVTAGALVELPEPTRDISGGGGSFNATMLLYPDATFADPVPPGGAVPVEAQRFFLEVKTDNAADVLGVPACTAAPTSNNGDQYEQPLRVDYCDVAAFNTVAVSEPGVDGAATHMVRWSLMKFKFGGFTTVHLQCTVVRCASPPCGTCTSGGGRRLQPSGGDDSTATAVAAMDFRLPPGRYLELPGTVPEEEEVQGEEVDPAASPHIHASSAQPPEVVVIALVATAVVLIGAAAAIGVLVVLRRRRAWGKAGSQGAVEGAGTLDDAMETDIQRPAGGTANEGAGEAVDEAMSDDRSTPGAAAGDPTHEVEVTKGKSLCI